MERRNLRILLRRMRRSLAETRKRGLLDLEEMVENDSPK